jgi:hypothetical protein
MYQCTRCRNVPRNCLGLKFQIQTLLDKTIVLSNRIEQLELALEDSFFEKNEIEKSEYKAKNRAYHRIKQLELALENSFLEKNEVEKSKYKPKYLEMKQNYFFFKLI